MWYAWIHVHLLVLVRSRDNRTFKISGTLKQGMYSLTHLADMKLCPNLAPQYHEWPSITRCYVSINSHIRIGKQVEPNIMPWPVAIFCSDWPTIREVDPNEWRFHDFDVMMGLILWFRCHCCHHNGEPDLWTLLLRHNTTERNCAYTTIKAKMNV